MKSNRKTIEDDEDYAEEIFMSLAASVQAAQELCDLLPDISICNRLKELIDLNYTIIGSIAIGYPIKIKDVDELMDLSLDTKDYISLLQGD